MTYSFDSLVEAVLYRFNCPQVEQLTAHYFSPDADIAAHVVDCPPCQAELESLRQFETATA